MDLKRQGQISVLVGTKTMMGVERGVSQPKAMSPRRHWIEGGAYKYSLWRAATLGYLLLVESRGFIVEREQGRERRQAQFLSVRCLTR